MYYKIKLSDESGFVDYYNISFDGDIANEIEQRNQIEKSKNTGKIHEYIETIEKNKFFDNDKWLNSK